jgi:hypothetical protein
MKKNLKKGASSNIFALWDKAAKAKKTSSTSTPNPPVEVDSLSPVESNLQLAIVEAQDDGEANDEARAPQPDIDRVSPTPIVEDYALMERMRSEQIWRHLSMILGSGYPSQGMMLMTRIELEGGTLSWGHVNLRIMIFQLDI